MSILLGMCIAFRVMLIFLAVMLVACRAARADGPPSADLNQMLATVNKVPVIGAKHHPGYERGCGAKQACSFGPAWQDPANPGCDTRDRVLARDLHDVVFSAKRAGNCKVIGGWLQDPYTGTRINFDPAKPAAIQIDHVYALDRAWDAGAWQWPLDKRRQFANDAGYNLLAVSGPANIAKGDKGPGRWLPPNRVFDCRYVVQYVAVAQKYGLPVDRADVDAEKRACR
jgi:Protein of unknown function (DUF1524)